MKTLFGNGGTRKRRHEEDVKRRTKERYRRKSGRKIKCKERDGEGKR